MINNYYNYFCTQVSDINDHLPTLKRYSDECWHITEMGIRDMVSTWAFLESLRGRSQLSFHGSKIERKAKYVGIDIVYPKISLGDVEEICKSEGVDFNFIHASSLEIEIEETDLLFIDTIHTGEQLKKELEKHAKKVKKYIIFHDTMSCEAELMPMIKKFLAENKEWKVQETFENNNGLLIIKHE